MYMCTFAPGWFYPGRIHRWRQRGSAGRGGDFSNGSERLLQGSVLLEHFNSVLLLLWWLIHQSWAFSQSVELGQELGANELLHLQRGIINYCEKLKCRLCEVIFYSNSELIYIVKGSFFYWSGYGSSGISNCEWKKTKNVEKKKVKRICCAKKVKITVKSVVWRAYTVDHEVHHGLRH